MARPASLGSIFPVLSEHDHPFAMFMVGTYALGWMGVQVLPGYRYVMHGLPLVVIHFLIATNIAFIDRYKYIMDILARTSQTASI